jgi:beta-galactosidase
MVTGQSRQPTPSEFDVTDQCRPGENVLAVQVMRWSDVPYLEDHDHRWLCGPSQCVDIFEATGESSRDD